MTITTVRQGRSDRQLPEPEHPENVPRKPHEPRRSHLLGAFGYLTLFCGPPLIALQVWRDHMSDFGYGCAVTVAVVFYLRVLLSLLTTKLSSAEAKGRRDLDGTVEDGAVEQLAEYLKDDYTSVSVAHLQQFAWSLLTPAAVRRRVTDEYTPDHRTLRKSVSIEFSFDRRFHQWPLMQDHRGNGNGNGHRNGSLSADGALVAITMPKKGQLYDHFSITDAAGTPIPRLPQVEYRILVAKTLRALLRAAFGNGDLSPEARIAERNALEEIIRFGLAEPRPGETDGEFRDRHDEQMAHRREVLDGIENLELSDDENRKFLRLAVELVSKLSLNYAVVVVLPGDGARYVVKYAYTLIPDLELGRVTGRRGLRSRLHFLMGTRPVYLSVSARNAAYCQSYHLAINASTNLYVGDFDIDAIIRRKPYWRVRGRRGQHYFHLYTRGLKVRGKQGDADKLTVKVKFFEVPPGSLGHAGIAALACLAIVAAVGWTVTQVTDVNDIDTQIAAFLLAIPGLAAAWLGFESRSTRLFEGTLTARLSSTITFLLSMSASILLLLTTSGIVHQHRVRLFAFGIADGPWSVLVASAAMHAAAICAIWWQRAAIYRRLAVRPVGNSSPLTMS
jgi:hypothetical protein